jgi:hypothetical protein
MELVKTHLTSAVNDEIHGLKVQIKKLNEKCSKLEQENLLLRQLTLISTDNNDDDKLALQKILEVAAEVIAKQIPNQNLQLQQQQQQQIQLQQHQQDILEQQQPTVNLIAQLQSKLHIVMKNDYLQKSNDHQS